jgi:hypothetical protein
MDKPTSKTELLTSIKAERKNLERALKGLSATDMIKAASPGEWSIQDIMAHITAWEAFLRQRYETGLRGEKQTMPDWSKPGVIDEINLNIYKQNHDRWLKEVQKEFKESYKKTLKTVKSIPEEAMFTRNKYEWTGKATLADYIEGNTCGHYAEHIAMIEAIKQKLGV